MYSSALELDSSYLLLVDRKIFVNWGFQNLYLRFLIGQGCSSHTPNSIVISIFVLLQDTLQFLFPQLRKDFTLGPERRAVKLVPNHLPDHNRDCVEESEM